MPLYVANGRTVVVDSTSYGPGSEVTLSTADAALMLSLGHVQETPPTLPPPAAVPVRAVSIVAEGGPA